ncbi:hypothetical protein ACSSS7_005001 [Eimeria intestinalis]
MARKKKKPRKKLKDILGVREAGGGAHQAPYLLDLATMGPISPHPPPVPPD